MASKRVRLIDGPDGILAVLEIQTSGQPGLLQKLTEVLFALRVQIVRFESSVRGKQIDTRLYVVEFDGGRIDSTRRLQIQTAILGALDRASLGSGQQTRAKSLRRPADAAKAAVSRAV